MSTHIALDCRGLLCPKPIIELARAAKTCELTTSIVITTDDPAAAVDIPAWSRMRGHTCAVLASSGADLTHEVVVQGREQRK